MAIVKLRYNKSEGDFANTLALPRSKSIAARALILRYLTGNRTRLVGIPDCDDSRELTAALDSLSALIPDFPSYIKEEEHRHLFSRFNLGLGGTSLRFFTALAASVPDLESDVDCAPPLRRRPFMPLMKCLRSAGASIRSTDRDGYAPVLVEGRRITGGGVEVGGDVSSQFASALMLVSPSWVDGLQLTLTGDHLVSLPYLVMTSRVMSAFGVETDIEGRHIRVKTGIPVPPERYEIEADWSAASYFYELALLSPGRQIRVESLTSPAESLQGDSRCEEIFNLLGVDTEHRGDGSAVLLCDERKLNVLKKEGTVLELDMNETPDLVPALAVGMCMAGVRFRLTGIGHLRHKESDRIMSVQTELEKIGFRLESGEDWMEWRGGRMPVGEREVISTYHDHRIAMSFAVAAVALPYIYIENPEVVDKSFSDFWNQMELAGFSVSKVGGES